MERTLEVVEVFDWYDGMVTGIVRCSWRPGAFVAGILCWDPDKRQRAFALVPVETHPPEGAGWDAIQRWVEAAFGTAANASVVVLETQRDRVVSEITVPVATLERHYLGDIEAALAEDRRRWLDSSAANARR